MKPHATAEGKPENSNGDKTLPPPPPPPTRVLLTNDDGPLSPFFVAWVEHVRTSLSWRAFAAPPAEGQSFVSKAVATGSNHARSSGGGGKPSGISLTRVDEETVHVSGPPATAVNLALHHLATDCDFVVSGPNVGHNVGRGSVLSSGTVGAALEGAVAGRKSVALSFPFRNGFGNWTDEELRLAVEASGKIVADLWENWGEGVDLYNVNVPLDFNRGGKEEEADPSSSSSSSIPSNPSPFRVATTTVDPGAQYSSLYKIAHPDSEHDFEWGPSGLRVFEVGTDAHPGGDVEAVREGRISVTPLRAALAHVESKQ